MKKRKKPKIIPTFLSLEETEVPISKKKETWENKLIVKIRINGFSLSGRYKHQA